MKHLCDSVKWLLCKQHEDGKLFLVACPEKCCEVHKYADLPTSEWDTCPNTGFWEVNFCPICGYDPSK